MEKDLLIKLTDTEKGESYWSKNGAYQKEYEELFKKLVPQRDEAETHHGELIRIISRFLYDWGNNGFCNVIDVDITTKEECETCYYCNGTGEVDDEDSDDGETIDCDECSGLGEIWETVDDEYIVTFNEFWDKMFNYLVYTEPSLNFLELLRKDLISGKLEIGTEKADNIIPKYLNEAMDKIIYLTLTTENKPIIILNGSEWVKDLFKEK